MSLANRAFHQLRMLGRYAQDSAYDKFRNAYYEESDFDHFDATDDFVVSTVNTGTADVIDGAFGLLQLDAASATADNGVQIQHKTETVLPAAGKPIIFEARLKVTDTIALAQVFAGLSILDTTMMAAGANTSANHIGLEANAVSQAAAAGRLDLVSEKGGVRDTTETVTTLVEDTYLIVGFFVDGITAVTPLINGEAGTPISAGGTYIPVTELATTFACLSEGTVDPILTVDWYYLLQVR